MNWAVHYIGRVRCVEVQSEGLKADGRVVLELARENGLN